MFVNIYYTVTSENIIIIICNILHMEHIFFLVASTNTGIVNTIKVKLKTT